MRLNDIGEFGIIRRIAGILGQAPADVVEGIGDDVAVLRTGGPEYLLATCDAQVENIHFRLETITPYQLGRKVAAINLSDIAAMGGIPSWGLASLALPGGTKATFVDGLYEGMRDEMAAAGAAIVGGNLSGIRSEIVISFCLLGRVAPESLVLRRGARKDDLILVTGWPGESRAGLEFILRPELPVAEGIRKKMLERHLTPTPRLREGQLLGRSGKVHAMVDVSDGILGDLRHICEASGLGAELNVADLPISPECVSVAAAAGVEPEKWVLTGGEDFELLFTASLEDAAEIRELLMRETGLTCHMIGRMKGKESGIVLISSDGSKRPVSTGPQGWEHFT
jgi:thiamine-monophosphate kinase